LHSPVLRYYDHSDDYNLTGDVMWIVGAIGDIMEYTVTGIFLRCTKLE
jgi:hypothetical protein